MHPLQLTQFAAQASNSDCTLNCALDPPDPFKCFILLIFWRKGCPVNSIEITRVFRTPQAQSTVRPTVRFAASRP